MLAQGQGQGQLPAPASGINQPTKFNLQTTVNELLKNTGLIHCNNANNSWSLSATYSNIEKDITDISYLTSYKTSAGAKLKVEITSETGEAFNNKIAEQATEYIVKKRAALVYICGLYILKIKEKDQSVEEEKIKLQKILDSVNALHRQVNVDKKDNVFNPKSTTSEQETQLIAKLATVSEALTALLKKKAEGEKEKDTLLKEIIPFIAKQAELGDIPPQQGAPSIIQ